MAADPSDDTAASLPAVPDLRPDLDTGDVAEVMRRVVLPVVQALTHPGELRAISLRLEAADETDVGTTDEVMVLQLDLGGSDRLTLQVAERRLDRADAAWLAGELEQGLAYDLMLSEVAWGQVRESGAATPDSAWAGTATWELYPDEAADVPLWHGGQPLKDVEQLLSAELVDRLRRWQRRWETAVTKADEFEAHAPFDVDPEWPPARAELFREREELLRSLRAEAPSGVRVV